MVEMGPMFQIAIEKLGAHTRGPWETAWTSSPPARVFIRFDECQSMCWIAFDICKFVEFV